MYDGVRQWIIGIVVTIIFMSIVDLILPENSFRKYAKLATGLIVIIAILSPVFKLFKGGITIEQYIESYSDSLTMGSGVDTSQVEAMVDKETLTVFKENLKDKIEGSVLSNLDKTCKVTDIEIDEDTKSKSFGKILYMEIRVNNGMVDSIEPVDKVIIGGGQEKNSEDDLKAERDDEILKLLKDSFGVDASTVKFLK